MVLTLALRVCTSARRDMIRLSFSVIYIIIDICMTHRIAHGDVRSTSANALSRSRRVNVTSAYCCHASCHMNTRQRHDNTWYA